MYGPVTALLQLPRSGCAVLDFGQSPVSAALLLLLLLLLLPVLSFLLKRIRAARGTLPEERRGIPVPAAAAAVGRGQPTSTVLVTAALLETQ